MFLGGSVGYLSQFVVVPYLVAGFENELVGAFWTGDAATSVIAALVAIVQRPAADSPTFGARAYHAGVGIPVVLASAAAFLYVERAGAGRLAGAPADGEARGRLLDDEDGVELVGAGDVSDAPPPASRCSSLAPDGAPAYWKDALTWQLAAVVFWSQFADWGPPRRAVKSVGRGGGAGGRVAAAPRVPSGETVRGAGVRDTAAARPATRRH